MEKTTTLYIIYSWNLWATSVFARCYLTAIVEWISMQLFNIIMWYEIG